MEYITHTEADETTKLITCHVVFYDELSSLQEADYRLHFHFHDYGPLLWLSFLLHHRSNQCTVGRNNLMQENVKKTL